MMFCVKILCLYSVIRFFKLCGVNFLSRIELVGWLFLKILNGNSCLILEGVFFFVFNFVLILFLDLFIIRVFVWVKKLDKSLV